jgi:hypothetical protein
MNTVIAIVAALLLALVLWGLLTWARCYVAQKRGDRHERWLLELPSATSYKLRAPVLAGSESGIGCQYCGSPRMQRIRHGASHTSVAWTFRGLRRGTLMTYWSHVCLGCVAELFRTREPTARN